MILSVSKVLLPGFLLFPSLVVIIAVKTQIFARNLRLYARLKKMNHTNRAIRSMMCFAFAFVCTSCIQNPPEQALLNRT
jgi:hypothetical protein